MTRPLCPPAGLGAGWSQDFVLTGTRDRGDWTLPKAEEDPAQGQFQEGGWPCWTVSGRQFREAGSSWGLALSAGGHASVCSSLSGGRETTTEAQQDRLQTGSCHHVSMATSPQTGSCHHVSMATSPQTGSSHHVSMATSPQTGSCHHVSMATSPQAGSCHHVSMATSPQTGSCHHVSMATSPPRSSEVLVQVSVGRETDRGLQASLRGPGVKLGAGRGPAGWPWGGHHGPGDHLALGDPVRQCEHGVPSV